MRANRRVGLSRRACRIGRAKAAVFPDPVSARPMMSLPGGGEGGGGARGRAIGEILPLTHPAGLREGPLSGWRWGFSS